MNPNQIALLLRKYKQDKGITQKQIEKNTHVNQGQISRILKGDFSKVSDNVKKLCKYANIKLNQDLDPSQSKDLMNALKYVWDGTEKDAKVLAKVIRSLKNFKR